MFSEFNEQFFPIVQVTFNHRPNNDEEIQMFLNHWLQYYQNKKDFTFYFDTLNLNSPHPKYCIQMSLFIKELRKKEYQYLKKSIILINDNRIKWMLEFIFWIQPPVAPVYIYHINNGIGENIKHNIEMIMNHPLTVTIEAGKPLLPIF